MPLAEIVMATDSEELKFSLVRGSWRDFAWGSRSQLIRWNDDVFAPGSFNCIYGRSKLMCDWQSPSFFVSAYFFVHGIFIK